MRTVARTGRCDPLKSQRFWGIVGHRGNNDYWFAGDVCFGVGLGGGYPESESVPGDLVFGPGRGVYDRAGAVMDQWLYDAVNGRTNWRPVKILAAVLAYGLLVGAAIYELVEW